MNTLEKLRKTSSLVEFAEVIGFKPSSISYILYFIPDNKKYFEFEIDKWNGDSRIIKAPTEKLKHLQKRLSDLLNTCYEEIDSINNNPSSLAHGFRKNHSIVTNAKKHNNKRYVFNIDLKDFFPSINFGRVRGFFIKNNHFNLDPGVATVIAQIACHNNELPQGSPCSPIISNLIGHLIDIRLVNLSKKYKCTYSRYADDITFSTNQKEFPQKIAKLNRDNKWDVGKELKREIEKVGFALNEKKTSLQHKTSRQMATGLIVNKKPNIRKEYYKKIRSMCHSLFQNDEYYLERPILANNAIKKNEPTNKIPGSLNQLEGMLGFIYYVKETSKPKEKEKKKEKKDYEPEGITKLYKELLFYKYFFSLKKPLLVCEGKTDIIYLKCALKGLVDKHQRLISKIDGDFNYKVGFLNISKAFRKIPMMPGGSPGLKNLIVEYKAGMVKFKGDGKKHPVIIVLDNDGGAKEIKSLIKEKFKIKDVSPKRHYRIDSNLYVVFSTEKDGEEIEDLFEKKLLKTKLDGKSFSREKEIDINKEFGKIVFAEKIIKEKQNMINYNNFHLLLEKINLILEDYYKIS